MVRVRERKGLNSSLYWYNRHGGRNWSNADVHDGVSEFPYFQKTIDDQGLGVHGTLYLIHKKAVRRWRKLYEQGPAYLRETALKNMRSSQSWMDLAQSMNSGGGFSSMSESHTLQSPIVTARETGIFKCEEYIGHISPCEPPTSPNWSVCTHSSWEDLSVVGARAVAATRPTKPGASVATMVGELREGLPSMLGQAVLKHGLGPRTISDEYLNYQFGIAPLVSDLNDLVKAFEGGDQRWSQLQRDSGRRIRRRLDLGTTVASSTTVEDVYVSPLVGLAYFVSPNGRSTVRRVETIETHRWFSGAYRYLIPSGLDPFSRYRRQAAKWRALYGADVSLATVYELAPWTWLFEWFANFQNALSNAVAFTRDDLVMEYGYIMEHKTMTRVHDLNATVRTYGPCRAQYVSVRESKYRAPANPYGFGLLYDNLSTRQLSILAALGISKGSRQAVMP